MRSLLYAECIPADVTFEHDHPVSEHYGDVYFSRDGGVAESSYTYIEGNQLAERFAALPSRAIFTVAEIGFGSGLNFLLTQQCFLDHAPADALLCYAAVERHPLRMEDMQRILHPLVHDGEHSIAGVDALLCALPPAMAGLHRVPLRSGRISLTLAYGSADTWLDTHMFQAHAWFMDGFSPAKNPDLWTEELCQKIASHSLPGATLATFSSAGHVRRALQSAGFDVQKRAGYGHKREMCLAHLAGLCAYPRLPACVQVVGAGIGAAAVAYALARRGVDVRVYTKQDVDPYPEASTNPAALIYPPLALDPLPAHLLGLSGSVYTTSLMRQQMQDTAWRYPLGGMLRLRKPKESADRMMQLPAAMGQATMQYDPVQDGLFLPYSGAVDMVELVQWLLSHASIQHIKASAKLWDALLNGSETPSIPTILACGGGLRAVLPEQSMRPVAGVLSQIRVDGATPVTPISYGGYYSGACGIEHGSAEQPHAWIGASFLRGKEYVDAQDIAQSHTSNKAGMLRAMPYGEGAEQGYAMALIGQWAGVRYTTRNRLPLVGQVENGCYVAGGYGSKALSFALLAGELLADHLCGTPKAAVPQQYYALTGGGVIKALDV